MDESPDEMSEVDKQEFYNIEDIIEMCPESPPFVDSIAETESVHIIYVCELCLRQYTLVEDLRGHMIEYHKYKPLVPDATPQPTFPPIVRPVTPVALPAEVIIEPLTALTSDITVGKIELRPMPFKDFRLVLRAAMTMRCTFAQKCPYKFESAMKLEQHVKCHVSATAPKEFKCSHCSLSALTWRRCSSHLWKLHELDVDMLQCPECTYKAHASVLIWRHMRVHKKWRPRVLRSLRVVQRQRQESKQKSLETPPKPPTVNKNKYYVEKTCEICNRKFVNGKTLSKHVKSVHNKIQPFICNVCGKKTTRKASLIIHMRQHTGEKPLQCKTCKFSTRDPSALHNHQKRHENVKRIKCKLCGYSCIQSYPYKQHVRQNHPEAYKEISCELCSYSSINPKHLEAHKEDHRKGLIVNNDDSMDATRINDRKNPRKLHDKNNEMSADCFLPLESIDSLPHEPAVDTGGITIPAPSEDTQFPTYLNI